MSLPSKHERRRRAGQQRGSGRTGPSVSLTGDTFLGLVIALTVLAFLAAVVIWPSLAGRGPAKVAARAGTLLLVNALVLLTAATQLNAQFLFFADWTDLQGALTGTVTTTGLRRGGNVSAAARTVVHGRAAQAASSLPALPAGASSTSPISYTVRGHASGIVGTLLVRLPQGYTATAHAGTRYPVIETFQGYPSTPSSWLSPTSMNLPGALDQGAGAHTVGPALIVSPQVEIPAGVDTECVNGRAGLPQLETWLTVDVPNWVASTFRVRTDRGSWAAVGLSAGGWCAAMAAMLHPAQYGAAVVLGGYFRPQFGLYEPYPAQSPLARRYDLVALARRRPPPTALWLETSHTDATSYSSSAALLKAARPPLAVDATVLQHAGHRVSIWQALLPSALTWLGSTLPGFSPGR